MHRDQFKDLVGHKCVAGTVVTFHSFTQEVPGSNNLFKYNILSLNSVTTFRENSNAIFRFRFYVFTI